MVRSRRDFLRTTGGAALITPFLASCGAPSGDEGTGQAGAAPMRVLILGGTGFIGPHMVEYALERGHTVSVFNRGRTNPGLFADSVEKLVGDRDGDLTSLEGKTWDVVIDNSGYVPRHVRDSAQLLSGAADHYLFTSTAGVYAGWYNEQWPEGGITNEDAPLAALPEPESEDVGRWYGQLKVKCEEEVMAAFPGGQATITRPGLIVGPGDSTDRFTYYPLRVSRGGEMLAFGNASDPVQYIDARDLARFTVHCVEQRVAGVFNALGPRQEFTMGQMLESMRDVTGADTTFTWVPSAFLEEWGVTGFSMMPWIPQDGPLWGAARFGREAAFQNGMVFRPFEDTVRDTLEWWTSLPEERRMAMRAGLRGGSLSPQEPASLDAQMTREAEILAAWHAQNG